MSIHHNDRVLVTGAASGLGLALVKQFLARGCRVLATDRAADTPAPLVHLAKLTYLRLDVRSDDDWQQAYDWVAEHWNGLDVLVNNAGVAAGGRIELTDMDQWQWIIDINLLGVVRGCRSFTPMLKQQRSGHLVNVASAAGLVHPPRMSEYNSVKAAVVALSETLTHELKPFGVTVGVVCPTFFRTNLSTSLRGNDPASREAATKLIDNAQATADEIAAEVLKGIDDGRAVILTDRNGRVAYATKRFARPLYFRSMARAAAQMASKDT